MWTTLLRVLVVKSFAGTRIGLPDVTAFSSVVALTVTPVPPASHAGTFEVIVLEAVWSTSVTLTG
jgi:hypothetical protein